MSKEYYLVVYPQILVSIIINGSLPDNIKSPNELRLYESPEFAATKSNAKHTNTFILRYELEEDSSQYTIELAAEEAAPSIVVKKLSSETLKEIYVYNLTGKKLVTNLLNSAVPVILTIAPNLYPQINISNEKPVLVDVLSPESLVTYMKTGDLLLSRMKTLVNTVNCVGVMGKGIALGFKKQYPPMFADYVTRCKKKQVKLGEPYFYQVNQNRSIVNFPTKGHWQNSSKLEDVESGLQFLAANAKAWGITSMAVPPLGCGNGGLDWEDVRPLINKYLLPLKIPLEIYEPFEKPNPKKRKASSTEKSTPSRDLASFFQPHPPIVPPVVVNSGVSKKIKTEEAKVFCYEFDNDTVRALLNGVEVAHLKVQFESNFYWLDHIEVNNEWRRRGIGTQLIREAVTLFPKLQIPLLSAKEGYDGHYKYRLNEDVEKLVRHCLTLGIIKKETNCSQPSPKFSAESLKMV